MSCAIRDMSYYCVGQYGTCPVLYEAGPTAVWDSVGPYGTCPVLYGTCPTAVRDSVGPYGTCPTAVRHVNNVGHVPGHVPSMCDAGTFHFLAQEERSGLPRR